MENKLNNTQSKTPAPNKQYSYHEIIDYLDARWHYPQNKECIKQLNKAFNNIVQQVKTILIAGTNGKSLATHYTAHLLQEEGLKVGSFISPHILTYNERFIVNNETIQNKQLTEVGNEVIQAAESLGLKATALDLLIMMAFLYFKKQEVDVAILEVSSGGQSHPLALCNPLITGITRITEQETTEWANSLNDAIEQVVMLAKPGGYLVSADQSKINLTIMQKFAEKQQSLWAMPIRKLAVLTYPLEQLHGRFAALAERVAFIFMNECLAPEKKPEQSLFIKPMGQRGRPTIAAKRHAEINPRKTVDQFFKEKEISLPGRFQLLPHEKPTILLDAAGNLDAFENLFLGIRLLHYQRPLKGLSLILSFNNTHIDMAAMLKLIRYFFKKTAGQLFICPAEPIPGTRDSQSPDLEQMVHELKTMKIKVRAAQTFSEAFEAAAQTVDERQGLLVVTGSTSIINEFWRYKGMKKL